MKRNSLSVFLLLLICGIFAQSQTPYIIRPSAAANVTTIAQRHGLNVVRSLDAKASVYLVKDPRNLPPSQLETEVGGDSEVGDFESDQETSVPELNQSTGVILDQIPPPAGSFYGGTRVLRLYLSQIAPRIIRLWSAQTKFHLTGSGTVAIIDTGVDPLHKALASSLVGGYDFVHNRVGTASDWADLDPVTRKILLNSKIDPATKSYVKVVRQSTGVILDQSTGVILDGGKLPQSFGHGTMVAGVVHLVAPTAKIMPLKAFSANGTARLSDILRAVYYAADHKAHVINMSFSLLQDSPELADAIDYAQSKGAICIAAAGNTGTPHIANPANLTEVMGIASTTPQDLKSHFTSYGKGVFLAVPGENIITTYPGNNYAEVSGTSFSAPFVAGTAALLQQYISDIDYEGTSKAMSHAQAVSQLLGHGRLDIYRTLLAAAAMNMSQKNP